MSENNHHRERYWRSLDQAAGSPDAEELRHREFPEGASELSNPISRRNFLNLMGASLALAGLAGCRRPVEKIIPYVTQPEEIIPGVPEYYATSMPFGDTAYGLVVECHEGRPTKIEGNPLHPSSAGKSSAFMQAEILSLYDPARSGAVLLRGAQSNWDAFINFWRAEYGRLSAAGGSGLAVLAEPFSSPTLARLRDEFRRTFPHAQFIAHEPVSDENIRAGLTPAGGAFYRPDYHYDKASVILALDSDFLLTESESLSAAGRFASRRRLSDQNDAPNRLYVVEPDVTTTGAMADHRLRRPRSRVATLAAALGVELEKLGLTSGLTPNLRPHIADSVDERWLAILAHDLIDHRGSSLIIAGRCQPPAVQALTLLLNDALGNVGRTIDYREIKDAALSSRRDLEALVQQMQAGSIETLIMIGDNPVYASPAGLRFSEALKRVPNSVRLGSHVDETSQQATWHLPRAHFLESWGDARAGDGSLGLIQPMIQPLFNGHSEAELLELLAHGRDRRGYDIVRETWAGILKETDFESAWRRILHDGILAGSALPATSLRGDANRLRRLLAESPLPLPARSTGGLEVAFQVSPTIYDGRYANNGWLQELPHPLTKLTWDNAAALGPRTAEIHGLESGDIIALSHGERTLELPVWVLPGVADDTVAVCLGYGRTGAGPVGNGVGGNAYLIRPDDESYFTVDVSIAKTGRTHRFATTQDHGSMEGRPIVREADLEQYRKHPAFAEEMVEHPPLVGIYPEHDYGSGYQWGMAVDLTACTGCNACTIACQSENNIPIVGREQVHRNREMHWIRIDRYFGGDLENPRVVFQPVACQHCENAPCEQVCPVAATVHDHEGLNVMAYNRCIGTRYCSNNCPYKVRRFNFFNYTKDTPELVKMSRNPDVTVRSRGVMEKCTFCVQRVNRAKITAKLAGQTIPDGDVMTACQQACPSEAIVFGNINDLDSRVAKAKHNNRNYELLGEFNTRPRNSYLARIRNPHPDMDEQSSRNG